MIDWEKVRDVIIDSFIYDEEDMSFTYKDMIHVHGTSGDITSVIKEEIENQLNNPEEKHFYGGL